MAEIFPFRAVRYDAKRVALEKVLTQPYDKITAEMQERYYAANPYNLISIEKGNVLPADSGDDNAYTRASKTLDAWLAEGVLVQDDAPTIYAYFQDYKIAETNQRLERRGFIALGKLADYEEGVVFRLEHTLSAQ